MPSLPDVLAPLIINHAHFGIDGDNDLQIQCRDMRRVAHMAGHFLVLEGAAWILTTTGRTVRCDAIPKHREWRANRRNSNASSTPAKAFTDAGRGHVDELANGTKWVCGQSSAPTSKQRRLRLSTRNSATLLLRLDLGFREIAAHRLGYIVLDLRFAVTNLHSVIAVFVLGAQTRYLNIELQHGHCSTFASFRSCKYAGDA